MQVFDNRDEPETGVQILMAEDDPGHARLIRSNLRAAGVNNRLLHFADGEELMHFLTKQENGDPHLEFDKSYLLLLDVRMPRLGGVEALQRIKENPRLKLMPVVMLTTTDDPLEIRKCFELGCNQYVVKPVDYEQFEVVIQRLGSFLQISCIPPLAA